MSWRTKNFGGIGPLALVVFGVFLTFWPVFLKGYVLVPSDVPAYFDPTMQELNPEHTIPNNPLLSDHAQQFYVWHFLAAREMQENGRIPLWNPYILTGQPLLANAQPALFYPVNWLLFWLDPGKVAAARAVFNMLVAGAATLFLAKALGVSRWGSGLSAVAFAFSGALIVGPSHAYANSFVWLPVMMLGAEGIVRRENTAVSVILLGLGTGLSLLGGHPETAFHNVMIVTMFFGLRLWFANKKWNKRRTVMLFAGAAGMGLLIGAGQWLPFVDWFLQAGIGTTSRSVVRGTDSFLYAKDWAFNLPVLLALFFPAFFGHPVDNNYFWPFPTFQNFLEQSMYIGLVPLVLCAGAMIWAFRKKQYRWVIISLLAIFCLGVALRLPGFELVNHLPVLDRVNNTRLKWYFSFLAALLAGLGFDVLADLLAERLTKRVMVGLWGAVLLLAGGIFLAKWVIVPMLGISLSGFWAHLLTLIFTFGARRTAVSLVVLALGTVAYWLLWARLKRLNAFRAVLLGLTFIELVGLAEGYNTAVSPDTVFPDTRLTTLLKSDPTLFRIAAAPPTFWPNYGAVYGFFYAGGYDLPVHRYSFDLYTAQGGNGYRQIWQPSWPLADFLNIKYFISPEPITLPKLEPVFAENYFVYRNKEALPRAFMVRDVVVIPDEAAHLSRVVSGEFSFASQVALFEPLPDREQVQLTGAPGDGLTAVTNITYHNDRVTLETQSPAAGMLVMSDLYAPGWYAQVDDEPAHLYRANYAYRAVFVPAGHHQVTFYYDPLVVKVGKWLSLLGVVLALGIVVPFKRIQA